jgi:hypothetical protein
MPSRIGTKRRASLIEDIFNSEHDLVSLAAAHELSPDKLAAWANNLTNQRCLTGLCLLADLQTQVLLSRYRLLAAGRLIKLATQDDQDTTADVARRACVDLLKLDLKRTEPAARGEAPAPTADERSADEGRAALRDLLYGSNDDAASQDES